MIGTRVMLSGVAMLIFSLLSGCDYGRMYDQDVVKTYGRKMPEMDTRTVPVRDGFQTLVTADPQRLRNPLQYSKSSVELGALAYSYYCIHCHGPKADGNGTVGQSFAPLPTNLLFPTRAGAERWRALRKNRTGVQKAPAALYYCLRRRRVGRCHLHPVTEEEKLMMFDLLAPLIVGFAGSLHCLGMCGPLVVAYSLHMRSTSPDGAPNAAQLWSKGIAHHLAFHAGRILCYGLLGALASALGLHGQLQPILRRLEKQRYPRRRASHDPLWLCAPQGDSCTAFLFAFSWAAFSLWARIRPAIALGPYRLEMDPRICRGISPLHAIVGHDRESCHCAEPGSRILDHGPFRPGHGPGPFLYRPIRVPVYVTGEVDR